MCTPCVATFIGGKYEESSNAMSAATSIVHHLYSAWLNAIMIPKYSAIWRKDGQGQETFIAAVVSVAWNGIQGDRETEARWWKDVVQFLTWTTRMRWEDRLTDWLTEWTQSPPSLCFSSLVAIFSFFGKPQFGMNPLFLGVVQVMRSCLISSYGKVGNDWVPSFLDPLPAASKGRETERWRAMI